MPLDSTSSGGVPAAPLRWKPFAIGGAIFVLVIILIGVTRGGSKGTAGSPPTMGGPTMTGIGPTVPPPDQPIEIADPPMESGKAAKDWRKVIDHIQRGRFHEARKKLGDWERKYGATPETESLRAQLENRADIDDDRPRGPRHDDDRGPPGHRHEDD